MFQCVLFPSLFVVSHTILPLTNQVTRVSDKGYEDSSDKLTSIPCAPLTCSLLHVQSCGNRNGSEELYVLLTPMRAGLSQNLRSDNGRASDTLGRDIFHKHHKQRLFKVTSTRAKFHFEPPLPSKKALPNLNRVCWEISKMSDTMMRV